MRGAAEDDIGTEHGPGLSAGEVSLTDVENIGVGEERDVGAVIDGEQFAVAGGGIFEDLQRSDLGTGLDALVPQLDDVGSPAKGGVEELGEVTLSGPGICAQVERGFSQSGLSPGSCRLPCCGARWHLCGHSHRVEEFAGASQRG